MKRDQFQFLICKELRSFLCRPHKIKAVSTANQWLSLDPSENWDNCRTTTWNSRETGYYRESQLKISLPGAEASGASKLFSSVQFLSHVQLFATPWTAGHQASLSFTISQSLLKLMSIELVMPSNHLIPFSSCLQSFPASGSFRMSQLFAWGGQSIGVSASTSDRKSVV